MHYLSVLQPLAPVLSAIMAALLVDILLRLVAAGRDHLDPLLGLPAGLARWLQQKLDRPERSREDRQVRGRLAVGFVMIIGLICGAFLQYVSEIKSIFSIIIWFFCFRLTFIWTASVDLLKIWSMKDAEFVTKGMNILRRRHVEPLVPNVKPDRHAVARMLIESLAVSLHRGWLSPVFWALVSALLNWSPLAIGVWTVFLLEAQRVIVTAENKNSAFAQSFEVIESAINFIPARIAAMFFVLGAVFTPGAKPLTAFRAMFVQSDGHRFVNGGWPVAAVAGALNVALPSGIKDTQWLGPKNATAKAGFNDVKRALWLHCVTVAVMGLIFTSLLFLSLAS